MLRADPAAASWIASGEVAGILRVSHSGAVARVYAGWGWDWFAAKLNRARRADEQARRGDRKDPGGKQASGLSWKELAAKVSSGSPIVTTAALLGQMRLTAEEAEKAAELFSFTKHEAVL